MDTQQFKYFLQLCVDKNYAVASSNLYITQQALRKSIKRLEMETAGPLFYKSGDALELTKIGRCVKSHARRIINELDSMEMSLALLSTDQSPTITIASSYGIYPRLADKLIIPFGRKYPKVVLKIFELPDAKCEDAILNGDADLGFCVGPNDGKYFDVLELEVHRVCCMVSTSNPLSKRDELTLEDLDGQPLAIVNSDFKINRNFHEACDEAGFTPNIVLNGGDVISVQNFSRFDSNIAVTVDFLAEDLNFEESVLVPLRAKGLDWTINMLVRKDADLGTAAEEFVEFANKTHEKDE